MSPDVQGTRHEPANDAPTRVIATAGHVDHGKSTLIKALTGIDPDRLREEQERGMTIDLGFAHLRLRGGTEVGIVDVPGHQDFIRNMLAGVGSIDAFLLVVAADEGIMPQTREHLAILSLLGVDRGIVVFTKRDLVDDEWMALVRDEVRAALRGTPFEGAPVAEVSSTERVGLDHLVNELERLLGELPDRRNAGRPRLPVDRVFTMAGFGTVVTGTLIDGSFAVGDEVVLMPGDRRARIRGVQTHKRSVQIARPGSRVAMNLSGVDKLELERGMVIVRPGTVSASTTLAMRVRMLPDANGLIEHDDMVKVHVGTAEVMARVSMLERDRMGPGDVQWTRLHLSAPVVVAVGDRVILRRPSPSETLGGGRVADVAPDRMRRRSAVEILERRSSVDPEDRLLAVLDVPRKREEAGTRAGLDDAEREVAFAALLERGGVVQLGVHFLSRDAFDALARHAERLLAMAHRQAPLRRGLPREEVRTALGLMPRDFSAVVEQLERRGLVREHGSLLALTSYRPTLSTDQEAKWQQAKKALERDPMLPPSLKDLQAEIGIDRDVVGAVADRGEVLLIGDAAFLPEAVRRFGEAVIKEVMGAGKVTVSRARDLTGSTRKYVVPLFRFLDERGITRRLGDERVLAVSAEEAHSRLLDATRRRGPS